LLVFGPLQERRWRPDVAGLFRGPRSRPDLLDVDRPLPSRGPPRREQRRGNLPVHRRRGDLDPDRRGREDGLDDPLRSPARGGGVYESTDGGIAFARVGSPEVGVVITLAKSGGRLFAGTGNYGVSVSDDGGATWKNAHVTTAKSLILSVDEAGGVYLGTHFDG